MKRHLLNILACPVDKNPLKLFELKFEATDEIVEGILYCQKCHRWYPITEGIPTLLPDKYRNFSEVGLLYKYRGYLPVKLIEEGKPFNISSTRPEENKVVDAQKLEKRFRDEYITTRHQARKGWQPPNCISLVTFKTVLKLLNATSDDLILDVGIGPGTEYTRDLAKQNIGLIGIDFSFPSLKFVNEDKEILTGENKVHVIQADACHLPFSDEAFDKVISTQVIQHLPFSDARNIAFSEINRVLRPNGAFILETLNEYYLLHLIGKYFGIRWKTPKETFPSLRQHFYLYLYNQKELINALSEHFTDISIKGMHSLFPLYIFLEKAFRVPLKKCKYISASNLLIDRYLPSQWWARSLIAKCRKK